MFTVRDFSHIRFNEEETKILQTVFRASQNLNIPAFLVGGHVRDKLLGRASKDLDFTCVGNGIALAEETAKLWKGAAHVSVFKNFGTAQLKLSGMEVEFVGARKESYQHDSRKPLVAEGTLEDDLARRDFTINALALELLSETEGQIIDLFHGIDDLRDGVLRTPLNPDITFSDDPLRMMRAVRFAAQLHFDIDDETFEALERNAERINIISMERVSDELNKIILSTKPSVGFKLLHACCILKIIFPEFVALEGTEMKEGKGHKDNFHHTLQVLDNISMHTDDLWVRWAAVLHDIAKPMTKRFEAGHGWTFHGHDAVGAKWVSRIFRKFRLPMNEKMKLVEKLVFLHLRPISLTKENITDSAIRRLLFEAGEDIEALMMLCEADITSKNRQKVMRYLQNFELVKERMKAVEEKDHIRSWQPPITGEVIMETFGVGPSKIVGDIKTAVKDAILDGVVPNDYEAAFKFMLDEGKKLGLHPTNAKHSS
ncbi:MAG TPA: HD domain-containing protein [Chitinophagales bacterium]|nr:HD domain-containing protein [Chitinophagales bacterium]